MWYNFESTTDDVEVYPKKNSWGSYDVFYKRQGLAMLLAHGFLTEEEAREWIQDNKEKWRS